MATCLHVLGESESTGFMLDTGVQDDKVFGINGTIEEMAFNPTSRMGGPSLRFRNKSHTLVKPPHGRREARSPGDVMVEAARAMTSTPANRAPMDR